VPVREIASVDGRIAPTRESALPLPDDGLYRGDGAFEVIRLYGGRPFALAEHLDRLERSAAALALEVDRAAFEREIEALLAQHGSDDAQLRLLATRGGRRIALVEPLATYGESVTLASVTYSPTLLLDGVKSLSYAANMLATRIARERDADEAVLVTPDGVVLEPPTSSLFWATADGELRTPSLECPILDSITRRRVVAALPVSEGEWPSSELAECAEAFLASTTREIQPVAAIDGRGLEAPGERTREAQAAFRAALAEELGAAAEA
jgi:branched-chain amino acid aminotransferase